MRFTVIFEQAGKKLGIYPVEVEEDGDLELGITQACRIFRRENPDTSLFDGVQIRVERDV
jgi:hypothetical protein